MAVFSRSYTATQLTPVPGTPAAARGRSAARAATDPWRGTKRTPGVSRSWRKGAGDGCGERADGAGAVFFPGGSRGEVGELVNAGSVRVRPAGEDARAS